MAHLASATFLMVNDGQGGEGEYFDLTPFVTETSSVSWEIDKELTKVSPGTMTFKVADPQERLWNWLQSRVLGKQGALPPWVFFDLGDYRRFFGLLPLTQCTRLRQERQPTLEARDWSTMLGNIILDWERPWPNAATEVEPAEEGWCSINPRRIKRLISDEFAMDDAFTMQGPGKSGKPMPWVRAGQMVRVFIEHKGNKIDKRYKVARMTGNTAWVNGLKHDVGGMYDRHAPHPNSALVRTLGSGQEPLYGYEVTRPTTSTTEKPSYDLYLKTLDGLVLGDKLEAVDANDKAIFTVAQLDAAKNRVLCVEEVNIEQGVMVMLSEESRAVMVFEDARQLLCDVTSIKNARGERVKIFDVDLGRFKPAFLPLPAFCWLPMRPHNSCDVMPVHAMDNLGDKLKIYAGMDNRNRPRAYEGNPDDGWEMVDSLNRYATWTDQRVHPPKSLMPYEVHENDYPKDVLNPTPEHLNREKSFYDTAWYPIAPEPEPTNSSGLYISETNPASTYNVIPPKYCPDYASNSANSGFPLRRLIFNGTNIVIQDWAGNGWTNTQTATWPGLAPSSVVLVPGALHHVCGVSGQYVTIAQIPGGASRSAQLDARISGSMRELATTPWGIYLITENSYSRIKPSFMGSVISDVKIDTCILTNDKTAKLYPNTFVGIDQNTCAVFGYFTHYDPFASDKLIEETHLLILNAYPIATDATFSGEANKHPSVKSTDKVIDGAPVTIGCTRDPSALNRVVGHCGGQLFQIAKRLPWTIERFTPGDMSAIELVEHICQIQMAVAYPDQDGTLHIVSRNMNEAPTELDIAPCSVETEETLVDESHYSYIVVSGSGNDVVGDSENCVPGGAVMEMSGHPMIHSSITAKAIAEALSQVFGVPKKRRRQKFAWTDTGKLAPWLLLEPFPTIRIKGEPGLWKITGIDHTEVSGEAELTLLEQPALAYGEDV